MDGPKPPPQPDHTPTSHEEVASYFPEYVAEILAGGSPEKRYPYVATHLAVCAACSLDLDELLLLTMATYDDDESLPPEEAEAEIPPIRLLPPEPPPQLARWRRGRQGVWAVTISPGLLARGASPALAGTARGDNLLFDLRVPPEGGAPELRVEVYRASSEAEIFLRVSVDSPDLDPLEMGGVEITATAGERVWRARTDDLGTASLRGIPRPALDGLELGVTVGRSA